jgi:hypothetical protein
MYMCFYIYIYTYISGALLEIFFRATATYLSDKGEEGLNEVNVCLYMYIYVCMCVYIYIYVYMYIFLSEKGEEGLNEVKTEKYLL